MRRIDEAIRESSVTQSSAIVRWPFLTGRKLERSDDNPRRQETLTTDRDVNLNTVTPEFFKPWVYISLTGAETSMNAMCTNQGWKDGALPS